MTPDEVVDKISTLSEAGIIDDDERSALKSAITQIQDYQKLMERVSVENIILEINKCAKRKMTGTENLATRIIAGAIVTYLQQPTEHIER